MTTEQKCIHCGCTEENACPGGCSWVSKDPPVCSRCAEKAGAPPVFAESMGGALIDAARISTMAAAGLLPQRSAILLPGAEDGPSVHECLEQAMNWLDAARAQTIEQSGKAPTSLHVVGGR